MTKQIVVKRYSDMCIVKTIDVSNKSDSQIEKIEDGININLDYDKYFTDVLFNEDIK